MPLFNLTSIDFKTSSRTGGVSDQLISKQYTSAPYEIMKYPIDLGNYDKGHYMIFHVNEQIRTNYSGVRGIPDLPIIKRNQRVSGQTVSSAQIGSGSSLGEIFGSTTVTPGNIIGQFERPIRRTSKTIALYMPDTVAFNFNQAYSETSTTGLTTALLSAGKSIVDVIKDAPSGMQGFLQSLSNSNMATFAGAGILEGLKKFGFGEGFTQALGQSVLGAVQNPMLEVIYSSPKMRSFRFEFMFYPRDEKEALEVQKILQTFRFYQAPEILEKTAGFFLVPPSEFDILFFYNGKINPNIPPISTCVLESIDVDYAPNGWAAYETGDKVDALEPKVGGTGMPVAVRLTLQFRETEIVTKQFIDATEDAMTYNSKFGENKKPGLYADDRDIGGEA